jgi:hypothetical protein
VTSGATRPGSWQCASWRNDVRLVGRDVNSRDLANQTHQLLCLVGGLIVADVHVQGYPSGPNASVPPLWYFCPWIISTSEKTLLFAEHSDRLCEVQDGRGAESPSTLKTVATGRSNC